MLDRLRTYAREGASELFGFGSELSTLREQAADAKLLARRVEDLSFGDLAGANTEQDFVIDRMQHREMVRKAYLYYFGDPVVRRTADLVTFYTFGTGVARPRYRDDKGEADDREVAHGQAVIDRLWTDDENKATLTGAQAQFQKSLELQAQSNIFLVLFPAAEEDAPVVDPNEEDGPTNLKIADLPEREVTQIITHPRNRKVPVYYRRDFTSRRWNSALGEYVAGELKTLYYRDWAHDPPEDGEVFDGEEWQNPPDDQIAKGRVYHVKVNATSDMRFGVSEMHSIVRWARGLNDLMTSRMSTVQAIAQLAMQLKVRGNQRSVSQAAQQLTDVQRLAEKVDSGEGLARERADASRTKIPVTNQSAELQPMVTDTGAASVMTDVQTIKGQIAAGSGIPVHHLGDLGSANLANAVSMDGPLLKMIRARQQLWKDTLVDIAGFALKREGLDPDRLEVTMPPITDRDAGSIATMFVAIIGAIWPQGGVDRDMIRFVFGEILDAMGKTNAHQVLDELFPDGWKAPEPPPAVAAAPAAGPGQGPARQAAQGAENADRAARQGRRRSGEERGGTAQAQAQSEQNARDRNARALEAMPADLREVAEQALGEIDLLTADALVAR